MKRRVSIVGAPSSAGAYAPGQEQAPGAFRRHGLTRALEQAGHIVVDRGDTAPFRWRPDPGQPDRMNVGAVATTAAGVADLVERALADGDAVLVLGGDCTVELGTVAGALRASDSVALIYIDFDVDFNPPADSDGALDWTGVAHLLALDGAAPELTGLGPRHPMLGPGDVLFFSPANITEPEARHIDALGVEVIPMDRVKADPVAAARKAVEWAGNHDRLLVHIDFDVLSYIDFPIAENVRRENGLLFAELATVLPVLVAAPNWRALTLAEINPDHAPDEATAFARLIELLVTSLTGETT